MSTPPPYQNSNHCNNLATRLISKKQTNIIIIFKLLVWICSWTSISFMICATNAMNQSNQFPTPAWWNQCNSLARMATRTRFNWYSKAQQRKFLVSWGTIMLQQAYLGYCVCLTLITICLQTVQLYKKSTCGKLHF